MPKAIVDTDRTRLETILARLDDLEGFPRQYPRASGKPSPPGQGITETAGRIIEHPTRAEYALHLKPDVLGRHGGKPANGGTIPLEAAMVTLNNTWRPDPELPGMARRP